MMMMARPRNTPNESGADKFRRVAQKRVETARKHIEALALLATKQYDYTPEQVDRIEHYLKGVLDGTIAKFKKGPELEL